MVGRVCGNRASGHIELCDETGSIPLVVSIPYSPELEPDQHPWLSGVREGSKVVITDFTVVAERTEESEKSEKTVTFYLHPHHLGVDSKSPVNVISGEGSSVGGSGALYVYISTKNCLKLGESGVGGSKSVFEALALVHSDPAELESTTETAETDTVGNGVVGNGVTGVGVTVTGAGVTGVGVTVTGAGVTGVGVTVTGAGVTGGVVTGAGVTGAGVTGAGVTGATGAGVSGAGVTGAASVVLGFTSGRYYSYIHNGCTYRLSCSEGTLPALEEMKQSYITVDDAIRLELVGAPHNRSSIASAHTRGSVLEVGEVVSMFYLPKLQTAFDTGSNVCSRSAKMSMH